MNKELQKLLESDLLNEETKKELSEAIETIMEDAVATAKSELEAEYAKKFVAEKEELVKSLNELIAESVESEIKELIDDINHYKEIEPTYAAKLQEFKEEYAKKLNESFAGLVESAVQDEMAELKDDLMESKNNHFGMQIFESFKETFEKLGISEDMKSLKEAHEKLEAELTESKQTISTMVRESKMGELLGNLSGSKREVMKTILENVETDKLESRYNETIDSVLEESVDHKEEKADDVDTLTESVDKEEVSSDFDADRLRELSGIKK